MSQHNVFVCTWASIFSCALTIHSVGAQDAGRPSVSWVNSEVATGTGLSHHVLPSQSMGHDVGFVVWTPEGFDDSGKTRYPVVYFLHGMGGNEKSDAGGFSDIIRRAIADDTLPPVICVFPNGGRSGYRGTVETMIVDELIPLVDSQFPTKAEAASRIVAGFSMGGAGGVRLSIMHPDLFCGAASWGGGMRRNADALVAAADAASPTLKQNAFAALLVNGDQDRPDAYTPLAERFAKLEIPCTVVVLDDTPHNLGLYYQRSSAAMIEFLAKQLKGSKASE